MKKTLLLIITCALALLSSCKPNPNEVTNITGVSYYYMQASPVDFNFFDSTEGYYDYFLVINDTITRIKNDIINEVDKNGDVQFRSIYVPMDFYILDGKKVFLGKHFIAQRNNSVIDTTICPYWEIDGIRKDIKTLENMKGVKIVEENGDLYFILESFTKDYSQDYYISKNGETLTNILTLTTRYGRKILRTKKIGNDFYFIGRYDERPAYILTGESLLVLTQFPTAGFAFDIIVKDGIEYVYGFSNDTARVWVNGEKQTIPLEEGQKESKIKCVVEVGDDIYYGGEIDYHPAIWKNGKMLARSTDDIQYNRLVYTGPNQIPCYYKTASVIDMEIIGKKIYSLVQIHCDHLNAYHCAIEWDMSGDEVTTTMLYDINDILESYDLVEDLGFVSNSCNWFTNSMDESIQMWNAYYTRPRIYLKTK
ncbi:MAG: hypothetical protein Q4D14_01125 [Bacteroidales bacterium]|nr:hypothetical protein [Bacteroidales bacterium]